MKTIKTIYELRDYINECEDYPTDVIDIVKANGWVDVSNLAGEGICIDLGGEYLYLDFENGECRTRNITSDDLFNEVSNIPCYDGDLYYLGNENFNEDCGIFNLDECLVRPYDVNSTREPFDFSEITFDKFVSALDNKEDANKYQENKQYDCFFIVKIGELKALCYWSK